MEYIVVEELSREWFEKAINDYYKKGYEVEGNILSKLIGSSTYYTVLMKKRLILE